MSLFDILLFVLFISSYPMFVAFADVCDNVGCGDCSNEYCITCNDGYASYDDTCQTCKGYNQTLPISNTNRLYIADGEYCVDETESLMGFTFSRLPYNPINITLNAETDISIDFFSIIPSIPPCSDSTNINNYVYGQWYNIVMEQSESLSLLDINVISNSSDHEEALNAENQRLIFEVGTLIDSEMICINAMTTNTSSTIISIPYDSFYLFIGVEYTREVFIDITLSPTTSNTVQPSFTLDSSSLGGYVDNTTGHYSIGEATSFDISTENLVIYHMNCIDSVVSGVFFAVETSPNETIVIDTKQSNIFHYVEEITENFECIQLHIGKKGGLTTMEGTYNGVLFGVTSSIVETRYFFMTVPTDLMFRAQKSCVNNCGYEDGRGGCVVSQKRCYCEDGYGFEECLPLCYTESQGFTVSGNELCYLESVGCTKNCLCESGYTYSNHYCLSESCVSTGRDECISSESNCLPNCHCDDGYVALDNGKCSPSTCGDGVLDNIEECDGGNFCTDICKCEEGTEPDPDHPLACKETSLKWWVYVLIVIGILFLVLVVVFIVTVLLITIKKRLTFDPSIYRERQAEYYLNIEGSTPVDFEEMNETGRFTVSSTNLDFGASEELVEINKTYFNLVEIRNTRKKWMLVVLHFPQSPKYVFHAEPEFIILGPHKKIDITIYITLFCTTKIHGMHIPTTVYFSKSRDVFDGILLNLRNKAIDEYTAEDRLDHTELLKYTVAKFRFFFTLQIEAVASTDIDLDEVKLLEKPIGVGAYSTVYLGSYRSITVALKSFHWQYNTEEEYEELKKEVKDECALMEKLRNPFVVSYIGSVTYIKQISIVMQFIRFGSLSDYCRPEKVVIPLKLKLRILKDTSKGMDFLHENSIMHLDLKPDNILINSLHASSECVAKITDFGTSRIKKSDDKGLGTPIYLAPETHKDEYYYQSDVYSFAITAWETFYTKEPFSDKKDLFAIRNHVAEGGRLILEDPVPSGLKDLIIKCWDHDYQKRPKFGAITAALSDLVESTADLDQIFDQAVDESIIADLIEQKKQLIDDINFE
ncbi:Serine-threonine protein kinase [Entamoeba marina]